MSRVMCSDKVSSTVVGQTCIRGGVDGYCCACTGSKELHEECIKLLAWTETDPSGPSSQDMNYTM